ncbi:hypothetical protein ACHAW5_003108, partial [Stephanodiscus triporus]
MAVVAPSSSTPPSPAATAVADDDDDATNDGDVGCEVEGRIDRPPPAPPSEADDSSSSPDVELLRDVMVPMRDGVCLATDIYIPLVVPAGGSSRNLAANANGDNGDNVPVSPLPRPSLRFRAMSLHDDPLDGVLVRRNSEYRPRRRYPVILERTPYNKCGESRSEFSVSRPRAAKRSDIARHMCRRGYVVVMQDCRGKFASGGTFHKYVDEASDGHDLMKWLVRQPWCDPRRIGTMGFSYDAHVQCALATSGPRGLACMYVDSGGFSNAYHNGIRRGGAFEMKQ